MNKVMRAVVAISVVALVAAACSKSSSTGGRLRGAEDVLIDRSR